MYEQKHIDIPRRIVSERLPNVAFYGNKVVATDSFRLIEMEADGEAHESVQFPAQMLKAVKIPKGFKMNEDDFKLQPDTESKFPDYMQLSEKWDKEEYIEVCLNGNYLAELCSQLAKLHSHKKVVLRIPKKYIDTNPIETGLPIMITGIRAKAYLMPMINK